MKTCSLLRRLLLAAAAVPLMPAVRAASADPVAPWRASVSIRPVSESAGRHTIHTYYLTSPESPDGSKVLFYTSTTPDGHRGDLVVRDRASGRETIIARGLDTEDAHRAACQQWIGGGRRVAYHDVNDGRWRVHVVDLATGRDRVLAVDRQLGFGRAVDDRLPLYGCHWNPGPHRNLELVDAGSGEVRTVVTIADVEQRYGTWLSREFGGRTTSIFFPVLSPDGQRVFFKMSAPGPDGVKNNFMSKDASHRQGTVVYDLAAGQPVFMREKWGHPAWHPDSRRMIEANNLIFTAEEGARMTTLPGLPNLPGDHPSVSADGKLIVKDGPLTHLGGKPGEWGVVVCDIRGENYHVLHRFSGVGGATSWRRNHPHPIFSADSRRIYFNVNEGPWTRLHVAALE